MAGTLGEMVLAAAKWSGVPPTHLKGIRDGYQANRFPRDRHTAAHECSLSSLTSPDESTPTDISTVCAQLLWQPLSLIPNCPNSLLPMIHANLMSR